MNKQENYQEKTNISCSICLEECREKDLIKTKCHHYFHSNCLYLWILQNPKQKALIHSYDDIVPLTGKCPLCRKKINQIFDLTEHDNYVPKRRKFKTIF